MGQISKHAKSHLLWRAFHVIAAESNQPEINPFHVVIHITVQWNAILTWGITVAGNQAREMLFKWHHFVRFQLVHQMGGFMMTGACVKPVSKGYENRVTLGNQVLPLLISPLRHYTQELINRESCGGLLCRCGTWWPFLLIVTPVTQVVSLHNNDKNVENPLRINGWR